ncbi:SRPBCC family protein [Planctomicrobium piriforme]|uniref:Ligand-binding SRPBCC domain-containing protein n=1 Tax=Planctomicrobium piriforme TaxID=1576369 RepID=A0A1I3TET1_9PLAN|nr:SRPBCC family protein [Planctomicrobium piriforme]SFJ69684.1 Ligand-binding SRPBCC domain-containing protein [Planctomicrobium piriforme]
MVSITRDGQGWILRAEQVLPTSPATAFAFFSDAANLEAITPAFLNFRILTPLPMTMEEGALIDYRIRLHGLPIRWRTEITLWQPPYAFVDTQLKGPYKRWVHRHTFEPHPQGTRMLDEVSYDVPGGRLVNALFVSRDVRRIFEYRAQTLSRIFANAPVGAQE